MYVYGVYMCRSSLTVHQLSLVAFGMPTGWLRWCYQSSSLWCSPREVCRSTTASSFCQSHYINQNLVEGWESWAINLLHAPFALPTVWSVHTLFIATATLLVSSIPSHPFTLSSINSITFPLSFPLNSSLFFPFFSYKKKWLSLALSNVSNTSCMDHFQFVSKEAE